MATSAIGKWAAWYQDLIEPQAFGEVTTYLMAAEFLAGCPFVADWGCGKGFFGTVVKSEYTGIDGTASPFADVVADLTAYREPSDGILLRHVLEHNERWADILDNAVTAAQRKLCIVLFTPLTTRTHQIAWNAGPEVPDISFCLSDILDRLDGAVVSVMSLRTNTQYGVETVIKAVWP